VLFFGLAPAWHAGRLDLTHMAQGARARLNRLPANRPATRRLLVITEFALSLVLMTAATLLLRSFWDLLNVPLGFNPQNVMAVRTRLPDPNDPQDRSLRNSCAREAPFLREVLRRGRTLPGVEEVALGDTASIPLDESLRNLKN